MERRIVDQYMLDPNTFLAFSNGEDDDGCDHGDYSEDSDADSEDNDNG